MNDKRRDRRLEERLDCDVHLKGALVPARVTNVSRRGLFILLRHPPPVGHVVTLTVHLPGGAFDLMATVQRHAGTSYADEGAGLLIFALSGPSRTRWEAFVRAGEEPGFSLAPTAAPPDVDAAFLVQLDSPRAMLAFFDSTIAPLQTVYVMPPYKRLGARVAVFLVHPQSEVQEAFFATVSELSPDRPERMGLKFDAITRDRRASFLASIGPTAHPNGRPLVEVEPTGLARVTEYAFVSPKLRSRVDEEPLAVVHGQLETTPAPPPAPKPAPTFLGEPEPAAPPELEHVDRGALFDFNWDATEKTNP